MVEDKRILYKVATQFEVQPSVLIHIQKLIIAFVLVFVIILHANFCVLSNQVWDWCCMLHVKQLAKSFLVRIDGTIGSRLPLLWCILLLYVLSKRVRMWATGLNFKCCDSFQVLSIDGYSRRVIHAVTLVWDQHKLTFWRVEKYVVASPELYNWKPGRWVPLSEILWSSQVSTMSGWCVSTNKHSSSNVQVLYIQYIYTFSSAAKWATTAVWALTSEIRGSHLVKCLTRSIIRMQSSI